MFLHNSSTYLFERHSRGTHQLLWYFFPNLDQLCLELWQKHVFCVVNFAQTVFSGEVIQWVEIRRRDWPIFSTRAFMKCRRVLLEANSIFLIQVLLVQCHYVAKIDEFRMAVKTFFSIKKLKNDKLQKNSFCCIFLLEIEISCSLFL
jgi:hypothetical protein